MDAGVSPDAAWSDAEERVARYAPLPVAEPRR
jgi:hypothetical protein